MKVFVSLIAAFLLCLSGLSAQVSGDYRSVASGNWTTASIWQTYNGTSWVAATFYPGQLTAANDVSIIGGYSVSISSNIINTVNSLTVGDDSGATDNFFVSGNSSLNTQLVNIDAGGHAEWTSNSNFSLPAGASFFIDPDGELATDNPCNAAKRLIIGASIYSTCNGGAGAQYSFEELNDEGGTLAVSPTSNSPVCEGQPLNLFANGSGVGSASATYLWTGSNGYTSTASNPVVTGLAAGNYTFTVTIRDSGTNTDTNSTSVTILDTPEITSTTPGSRTGAGTVVLGATTSAGTLNWYASVSGGPSLGTGTSFTTPSISTTTTYYVQTTSINGCISARTAVVATINPPSAITNRSQTYRIKK